MSASNPPSEFERFTEALNNLPSPSNIRFIHLQWLDFSSTLRSHVLPISHLLSLTKSNRYHGLSGLNKLLIDSSVAHYDRDKLLTRDQSYLLPDFSSLRQIPSLPHHAAIFCNFSEDISHRPTTSLSPPKISPFCPRLPLQNAIKEAAEMKLKILVGFEIEFTCPPTTTTTTSSESESRPAQLSSARNLAANSMLDILSEITDHLHHSGVAPVQHFQAEATQDQFEIVTGPLPPLEAADALILTKEAIRRICTGDKKREVSFYPGVGEMNGLHLNLSVVSTDDKIKGGNGEYEGFLAGVFENIDGLCAFGMARRESYARTVVGGGAAGRFKAWGTQNREVCVRRKGRGFWEVRFLDHAAQVHLFLGALMFAGLDGVRRGAELKLKDCTTDPGLISEDERRERFGITEELPVSVDEASQALKRNSLLVGKMGEGLITAYLAVTAAYNKMLDEQGDIESQKRKEWLVARL
ncbi:hypothetical protein QBC41DRAFT_384885 [Cercophora samala]|uniref:GS catalytic domain-containing protein n=1 Tax=Cercophora samala TaxID=330535 RepID=A0AA39YV45_9PEZI|nr:hypothetical protein QBC41DRAFT_384885 [Cercophora samala]